MKLLIIGPQASGKGTQADLLAKKLGIPHISTGDLLRKEIKEGTPLGQEFQASIAAGNLVPDEKTWALTKRELDQHPEGWILDGYPRTLGQAALLDADAALDRVVVLEVPDEVGVERISGRRICKTCGQDYHVKYKPPKEDGVCDADGGALVQREDDTPEAVRHRLKLYHEQTEPLVKHYAGKVVRINGDQGIQEVWTQLQSRLGL